MTTTITTETLKVCSDSKRAGTAENTNFLGSRVHPLFEMDVATNFNSLDIVRSESNPDRIYRCSARPLNYIHTALPLSRIRNRRYISPSIVIIIRRQPPRREKKKFEDSRPPI